MPSYSLPISLLRQQVFCPRIPFFTEVIGLRPAAPLWVQQGVEYHHKHERLLRSRALRRFGLESARRHFHCEVRSHSLGLHGVMDLMLETDDSVVPVEFKQAVSRLSFGVMLQLAAYGIAAEEQFKKRFRQGMLITGTRAKTAIVHRSTQLEADLKAAAVDLHALMQRPHMPDSPASAAKCSQCEFLNCCNDRA